jgi:hypothetical protein
VQAQAALLLRALAISDGVPSSSIALFYLAVFLFRSLNPA